MHSSQPTQVPVGPSQLVAQAEPQAPSTVTPPLSVLPLYQLQFSMEKTDQRPRPKQAKSKVLPGDNGNPGTTDSKFQGSETPKHVPKGHLSDCAFC